MAGTKQTGEVKNSIGIEEAKELICTTCGHELSWEGGIGSWRQDTGWRGENGGKWDNCNSIINKMYLKEKINLN